MKGASAPLCQDAWIAALAVDVREVADRYLESGDPTDGSLMDGIRPTLAVS